MEIIQFDLRIFFEKYASNNKSSKEFSAPSIQNGRLDEHMLRDLLRSNYSSIYWVWPPHSNSDHQDYYMFNRESL